MVKLESLVLVAVAGALLVISLTGVCHIPHCGRTIVSKDLDDRLVDVDL